MNNHFTITIHDDNGVKQINLHKFVKKAIFYGFSFLLVLTFIAVATILYLDASVDKVEEKKGAMVEAYNKLKKQNSKLNENMEKTNNLLSTKKQELDELADSLSEMEIRLGLQPSDEDISIQERFDLTKLTFDQRLALMQLVPNGSPIAYTGITSKYGYRIHPTLEKREFHRGTDLKAAMKTPVYAPADGIIEYSGKHKRSGFGRLVIVNHAFGFKTLYGHLNKVVVKSKQFVQKGELIAYTGNSGLSNGPHLHYEIRYMYDVINPYWFIKWTVNNYNEIFKKETKIPWQSLVAATSNLKVLKPTQTLPLLQLGQE
jgi:murein DD-endopeptidase MepM/ murein hydrolase activator NlpD